MIELDVLGVALWTPTQTSVSVASSLPPLAAVADVPSMTGAGLRAAPAPAAGLRPLAPRPLRPDTELLSVRARGRASLLTLMFANVIEQASKAAGIAGQSVPTVFGSAYGEMTTTLTLLELQHTGDGRLSPAKFQASVHNTAAGQISIAQGDRSFSTSIAAGHDTLAMALLEAAAWLQSRPGVLVLACADEAAPAVLLPDLSYDAVAVALVLSNVPNSCPPLARLRRLVQTTTPPDALTERENPCAAGLPLVRAIHAASATTILLNHAAHQSWQIDVLPTFPGP